jgi:hypothetical protein
VAQSLLSTGLSPQRSCGSSGSLLMRSGVSDREGGPRGCLQGTAQVSHESMAGINMRVSFLTEAGKGKAYGKGA